MSAWSSTRSGRRWQGRNRPDIDIEKAELPDDPHRTATELLEDRYEEMREELDDIDEFVPLVRELSEDRPELLASLVTELYTQSNEDENGKVE